MTPCRRRENGGILMVNIPPFVHLQYIGKGESDEDIPDSLREREREME
jgi:hypothetical protein